MARYLAVDQDQLGLDGRTSPYRFGGVRSRHGRSTVNRVNGYLKRLINEIANAKVRRMQREFALRGIHFDASKRSWVVRPDRQADRT